MKDGMYYISELFGAVVLFATAFVAIDKTVVPPGFSAPMALLGAFLVVNGILWLEQKS